MAKIKDLIRAHQQSHVKNVECPVPVVKISDNISYNGPSYAYCYDIEVKLGHSVWCRDSKEVEYQKQRVAEDVVQFLYGEFRDDFVNINCALYERDLDKTRELIHNMYKKMYD